MTNREIKQKVNLFRKNNDLSSVQYDSLRKATEKMGYTVVEYNHILNDEDVQSLIDALHISDIILRSKGFIYADADYRIVFIHEDLSDTEKMYILAHEIGHIYLGHLSNSPIIGKDVQDEYEANEFSHFLLHSSGKGKLVSIAKNHRRFITCMFVIIMVLLIGTLIVRSITSEKRYYGEYYITTTGSKYHEKNCIFVKDKENVRRLTKEKFESGEYEPCQTCLP